MSVIHKAGNAPFTMVPNKALKSPEISWKAKGLLAYFLSKPDGWQFCESFIVTEAKDSFESLKSGIRELEQAGYLKREKMKPNGRFTSSQYDYTVYCVPIEKNNTEMVASDPVKPDVGRSHTSNNYSNKTEDNKNSNAIALLTPSVIENSSREIHLAKEPEEGKEMLFNLPDTIKPLTHNLPYNHIAVKRYLKKIQGQALLPVKEFSDTDWVIHFVSIYNKYFPVEYPLQSMGPSFNGVVRGFSRLLPTVPAHNREEVFSRFIEIVKKGNRLPKNWQNGFVLEQVVSGYNFAAVNAEFARLNSVIDMALEAPKPSFQAQSGPVEHF